MEMKINEIRIRNLFTKDIVSTYANQFWRLISGPVSLILIPLFISPEIQGFWYTFSSISALSVFADLGFTTIILQFSAHEFAFLHFDESMDLSGPEEYRKRIASLFRFVLKWTTSIVLIAFPAIFVIGYILFIQKAGISVWLTPWIIYSIGAAIGFYASVVSSFVQGCDQVSNIQKLSLQSAIVGTFSMFISLILHFGLYSIAVSLLLANLYNLAAILIKYRKFLRTLWKTEPDKTDWKHDILRLLWKYALSWSSGYFIFKIYTPFMFQFHGPIEAGKVGITISLVTAIFSISNTWFSANTPKLNMLVAKREWKILDKEFRKNLILSLGTYLLGVIILFVAVLAFSGKWQLFDKLKSRFLGMVPLSMLLIGWFLQVIVNGLAIYLRAHKEEPYVIPSVVSGIFIIVTTFLSSKYLPSSMFFIGFFASYLYGLPWSFKIYFDKRREWHI